MLVADGVIPVPTVAPKETISPAAFPKVVLPSTVRFPLAVTLALLKVIAVVPSDALILLPPTLMSPANAVRVPEVRVMLVVLSDALMLVTPVMAPRTSSFSNGLVVPIPTLSEI